MALPHINIKATNLEMSQKIEDFIEEKLRALEKFIPKGETDLVCAVELEKDAKHQTGKIYRAEINMKVGGALFRAEATEENIEDAFAEAKNEIKAELRKANNKRQSLVRRGGKKIKDLMRFGRVE